MLQLLLRRGAEPNIMLPVRLSDSYSGGQTTPLIRLSDPWFAFSSQPMRRFMDSPIQDGWTPLTSAIRLRQAGKVRLLLQAQADPNIANSEGFTALHIALDIGAVEVVQDLMDAGGDIHQLVSSH